MNETIAIIQARMGSTRLPGKIMMLLGDKPVLWHVIQRVRAASQIDDIVVATTILEEDNVVEEFCRKNAIKFYRGSSDDVLSRYYGAAVKFSAETIVRITSDCPAIDAEVLDELVLDFKKNKVDYESNFIERTFPRGLDAEIFSFKALENAHSNAQEEYEREHVTPYIYQHPENFRLASFKNSVDLSHFRWTLDTPEDYVLLKAIYERLFKKNDMFLLKDILEVFKNEPTLFDINKDIEQKKLQG